MVAVGGQRGQHCQRRGGHRTAAQVFSVGMMSPKVKQTAVEMVAVVYSTVIIKVFHDLFKHHAEKDAEQSRCQNTPFYTVDDGEGSREVTIHPNLATLVFVQLDNHAEKLWGQLRCSMIIRTPFLLTVSNALVRPTNTTYSPWFCSLHFSWNCLRTTLCLWCPCWLWTHTGFLVVGLQWWWVPICLGVHKQGFFLRLRAEWSPDSWNNLTFLPCFCTR